MIGSEVDPVTNPKLEISGSRQFNAWLAQQGVSLAFTTYQTGKLFFIGLQADGRLSVFERTFNRAMGLWASPDTLYMSSLYQLWRFENALDRNQGQDGYDRLYVPQMGYTTGDIDVHDIAVDSNGRIVFVNTLFNLNGLAMEGDRPRYVTAVSQTDIVDGWRDRRHNGGCVIDVLSDEVILTGLAMPHSPRLYQDNLWLLNSGVGDFGYVDRERGVFEPITFCPGYMRGLAFSGDFAVVGLSKPRHNKTFSGLPLDDNLRAKDAEARCGLLVIDLRTGDIVHWLRLDGMVEELYDVVVLPGVQRPMALGFKTDEIRRVITIGSTPN
jgi:hypothetical protein